ncbi:MAG: choice-of-anchor J domain-containing protein, partial [Ignavibacteria bacterium]
MKKLLLIFTMVLFAMIGNDSFAQLNESFTGVTFPPTGWTRATYLGSGGAYSRSTASFRTTPACALSNFGSATGSENYLKTPQFTPIANDSLVFWFRQSFTTVYVDTFTVLVSTTDTAKGSFTPLLTLIDGVNYPTAATYGRFAVALGAYTGTPVYIAFRHRDNDGDAVRIDDISTLIPPPPGDDVGVSAAFFGNPLKIISAGKGYDMTATVTNYGVPTQNVVPVYYTVNAGPQVGPVNTVGPILTSGTENVVFSGGNAFVPLSAGSYTIKAFTALVGDINPANDTTTILVTVFDKISTFPYTETFTLATGWTTFGNAAWGLLPCVNPDGVAADNAARANFYSIANGAYLTLRSPEMDFTGMSNPVLDFYVAYKTYTGGESDTLRVMVSTDGGVTFSPAATSYNKSWDSDPSLATLPPNGAGYTPTLASQWRHETVDLSNVGNMSNVVIGFVGVSDFGNNAFVDNVIVSQPNSLCIDNVTAPGSYNCNILVTLDFVTLPAPPPAGIQSSASVKKNEKAVFETNDNIASYYGNGVFNSYNESDNPNGGTAFISQYTNNNPGQTIAVNGAATSGDGSIFTPSNAYHDYWFSVTYDGNDQSGYATYDITIDLDGLVFIDPLKLYVMKRTDATGSWECQNTTVVGNALKVTGLTDFSDFAIGGSEPLPVELSSFVSTTSGSNVTLNWTTASEINNSGFDIERSSVSGTWSKVGNVSGNGTSTTPNSYSYTDRNLASGSYSYRLKQVDFNGNFEYYNLSNEVIVGIPVKYDLSQNYPNPFNPSTKINYALPTDGLVSMKIFDMSGKEVMSLVNE